MEARLIVSGLIALPLVVVGGLIVTGLDLTFLIIILSVLALTATIILTYRSVWRRKELARLTAKASEKSEFNQ